MFTMSLGERNLMSHVCKYKDQHHLIFQETNMSWCIQNYSASKAIDLLCHFLLQKDYFLKCQQLQILTKFKRESSLSLSPFKFNCPLYKSPALKTMTIIQEWPQEQRSSSESYRQELLGAKDTKFSCCSIVGLGLIMCETFVTHS